jgi:hypothetical protein
VLGSELAKVILHGTIVKLTCRTVKYACHF